MQTIRITIMTKSSPNIVIQGCAPKELDEEKQLNNLFKKLSEVKK